ncbi:MAG: hypothetical protein ACT4UQ_03375 [Gammaproteobacteria bacterium]
MSATAAATMSAPAAPPEPAPAAADRARPEDSVVVRFEGGTKIPIRVGFVWPLPPPADRHLPARDQYAILRPLADAGDAAAARTLFQVLDRCQAAKSASGSPPRSFCEGITPEQMAESLDWLLRAAKGGDYDAGRWWAERLGDSQEGYEAWEARWRQGDPMALMALMRHYERGVPASTGGMPDPVRAHAYRLVDFHVREAVYANFKGLNTMQALHADSVRAAGGRLNPQQHAEAQRLAREILAGNPNCCRGMW